MFFKKIIVALFATLTLLGCNSCGPAELESQSNDTEVEESLVTWADCDYNVGDHPCNFELLDQNNDTFKLYDHVGKPIVLDFSTMWCGYCQVAAQEVQAVTDAYKDYDLLYVTVLIETSTGASPSVEDVNNWAQVFGIIDAPVLAGSRDMIDSSGIQGYPVTGWPTFVFIDDEMIIKSMLRGYSSTSLDMMIQDLLTE